MSVANSVDHATLEAAARWYVDLRCDADDEAIRQAHRRWLEDDPRHRQAWERLTHLQSRFDSLEPGLARPALASAHARRREVLKLLSLLLASGAVGTTVWYNAPLPELMADQRTGAGERRSIALDDGSKLQLNTASAVDIRYSDSLREIRLISGEILIETARDSLARPFMVHTHDGSIRALGTRFIVRRDDQRTQVCVLEHAVEVRGALSLQAVRVDAGQQVSFSQGDIGIVQKATSQADAWTKGMLVVSDWRLGEFIAELKRYRSGHLSCDPAVAALRISGAFHVDDTDIVLENLTSTLPVRIRRFSRYWASVEPA